MALTTILSAVVALQAPTAPVTVDLELIAMTKAPVPASIKPYRNALIAQEYKVKTVVKGKDADIKAGEKIRVLRWGILSGKLTSVAKAKKGDKIRLTIKRLAGWVDMEREYQVDTLESDLAMTYFVDTGKPK